MAALQLQYMSSCHDWHKHRVVISFLTRPQNRKTKRKSHGHRTIIFRNNWHGFSWKWPRLHKFLKTAGKIFLKACF